MDTSTVYQLLYRSKARAGLSQADLVAILKASRKNNPARGISGLLIYRDGYFLQILEGPEEAVAERFAVIVRDERHEAVELLNRGKAKQRLFGSWAMGYLDEKSKASNVKTEVLNQLHDFALRRQLPKDEKTILAILNSFKDGSRDLSLELP